jgi:hypothetical protein
MAASRIKTLGGVEAGKQLREKFEVNFGAFSCR